MHRHSRERRVGLWLYQLQRSPLSCLWPPIVREYALAMGKGVWFWAISVLGGIAGFVERFGGIELPGWAVTLLWFGVIVGLVVVPFLAFKKIRGERDQRDAFSVEVEPFDFGRENGEHVLRLRVHNRSTKVLRGCTARVVEYGTVSRVEVIGEPQVENSPLRWVPYKSTTDIPPNDWRRLDVALFRVGYDKDTFNCSFRFACAQPTNRWHRHSYWKITIRIAALNDDVLPKDATFLMGFRTIERKPPSFQGRFLLEPWKDEYVAEVEKAQERESGG